ncbi:DUF3325 family protein [Nitrincola alkalilacustris]|uniref:DUF3325 family protein n=1 Tax=Nitrincola alkalilacustris TaxID=1571224 RepID=UPI00124C9720|nr:DUF3325 family protein [Nitrincola alkalilacustris]
MGKSHRDSLHHHELNHIPRLSHQVASRVLLCSCGTVVMQPQILGLSIGLVAWFGVTTFAVFMLILQMAYSPRRVIWSAMAALVISVPSVLIF